MTNLYFQLYLHGNKPGYEPRRGHQYGYQPGHQQQQHPGL